MRLYISLCRVQLLLHIMLEKKNWSKIFVFCYQKKVFWGIPFFQTFFWYHADWGDVMSCLVVSQKLFTAWQEEELLIVRSSFCPSVSCLNNL